MLWSILIAGIPERYHSVQPLLHSLLEQQSVAKMQDVELLYFMDNQRRSVGEKRNALLHNAAGEYISFIDDDDLVASDYVQKIYRQIAKTRKEEQPADVICFPQKATLVQQQVVHLCTYSIEHWKTRAPDKRRQLGPGPEPGVLAWSGPPAHTMAWRRKTIAGTWFPEKTFGEDVDWVDQACKKAKTEIILTGEPLYYYTFDETKSATRG